MLHQYSSCQAWSRRLTSRMFADSLLFKEENDISKAHKEKTPRSKIEC
jgi:hypothetical protein